MTTTRPARPVPAPASPAGTPVSGSAAPPPPPGRPIDTARWCVIAPNVLGGCQGSTGPSSPAPDGAPYGSRFPSLTVRDQVEAERALCDALGIERLALVIGGSMGGMRAVEWATSHPERVERLAVIATSARASADQIAWNSVQIAAIRDDPGFAGGDYYDLPAGEGPHRGLGTARRVAHTTYRTAAELEARFSNLPQDGCLAPPPPPTPCVDASCSPPARSSPTSAPPPSPCAPSPAGSTWPSEGCTATSTDATPC